MSTRFPDLERLTTGLAAAFRGSGSADGRVTVLYRQPNPYETTSPTEIVTCHLGGNGSPLRLFCKYGTKQFDAVYGHRGDVSYEAEVYREVLQPLRTSTPAFYGVYRDELEGAEWLIVEYLEGSRIDLSSDPDAVIHAARWIGKFHAANEKRLPSPRLIFLRRYDADYYMGWARRTIQLFSHSTAEFPWLLPVCDGFEKLLPRLLEAPRTIIHGEYYPHNIIYQNGIGRPADWQSAAIAAGEIDLASLTHLWPGQIVQSCEREYRRSRWPDGGHDEFQEILEVARVYVNLRWLGDPGNVSLLARRSGGLAVPETCRKYIEELHLAGEKLGLVQ